MGVSISDVAGRADFVCRRGDSFSRNLTFTTTVQATVLKGVIISPAVTLPQSFVGCSFTMKVVDVNLAVVFNLSPIAVANVLYLVIPAAQMLVPAGNYNYDLRLIGADNSVITMLTGFFTVTKDSTSL